MKKRMISILLCCCMIMSLLPATALAVTDVWDGTSATYDWYDGQSSTYTIDSASDLRGFADIVNGTNGQTAHDFSGETVNLAADIDLNNQEWTPIGGQSTSGPYFKGTFDGQGHTVKNLKIHSDSMEFAGLFSVTHSATIQNLTVDGIDISCTGNPPYVGAIVGYAMVTVITNCGAKNGTIQANNPNKNWAGYAGAITGRVVGYGSSTYNITYCYNYEVVVSGLTTGWVGVGSITGQASDTTVASCYAYVTAQKDAPLDIAFNSSESYSVVLSSTSDNESSQRQLTAEQFAAGTAAAHMNGFSDTTIRWGQELGADPVPVTGKPELIEIEVGGGQKMYINELEQDQDGTYIIKNAIDWVAFANKIQDECRQDNHPNLNARVEKDAVIDFSTVSGWENGIPTASIPYVMIATAYQAQYNYAGTFDGNGCTVKGFQFAEDLDCDIALFGGITNGGIVKNITIENISLTTTEFAAGIVVQLNGGTVENCHIKGGTITSTDGGRVAGIAANTWYNQPSQNPRIYTNLIKDCTNSAAVTVTGQGYDDMDIAAGIAACAITESTLTIEDCHNTGAINAQYNYAGGIYGGMKQGNAVIIKQSTNTGTVSGGSFAGGIAGYGTGTYVLGGDANNNDASTIENCWNWGDVTATGTSAGIVPTDFKTTVQNCYSIAQNVTYGAAPTNAIANSYALDDTYTEERFNSGEIAYKLHSGTNGDIWGQEIGKDDYPIFNGKKVVQISFVMVTGESGTAPDPCYTNAGKILAQYPTSTTALYEFYSDEAGQTPLNTETQTYDTDTTVYVKAIPMQASVTDQAITGYTSIAMNESITVTLFGAEFNDTMAGSWITNLPDGLTQSVTKVSTTAATITISGTPTSVGNSTLNITIPASDTTGNKELTCTGTVTYAIAAPTYILTLDGTPGSFADLTYGYTTGSAVTYTFQNTGNQPITGISASITTGTDAFEIATAPDTTVAVGEMVTVTVTSKTGLGVSGSPYNGTLTLTWDNDSTGLTQNLSQTVKAAASSVTITSDISKTYDGSAVSEPTYDKVGDGTVTIEYKVKDADDSTYSTTAPADAGNYTVRVSMAANDNYAAASDTDDFTISPKTVEINWTYAQYYPYDGTDQTDKIQAYYLDINGQQVDLAVSTTGNNGVFMDYLSQGYVFTAAFANNESNYALPSPATKTYYIEQVWATTPNVTGVATKYVDTKDGEITGVTDKMEYRADGTTTYTPVPAGATEITGLAAGTYYVRYKASSNYMDDPEDYPVKTVTIAPGPKYDVSLSFREGLTLDKVYDGQPVEFTSNDYTYYPSDARVSTTWILLPRTPLRTAPSDAGQYRVTLTAAATDLYNKASINMQFTISQATNEWTTDPAISGWTYGKAASVPVAAAKFGTVTFTYSKAGEDNFSTTVPTEAGNYVMKATVAETGNWTGLETTVNFTISKAGSVVTPGSEADTEAVYGETLTLKVNIAMVSTFSIEPTPANKVSFYYGETKLGETDVTYSDNGSTGSATLTYQTTDGKIPVGTDLIVNAYYGGGNNLTGAELLDTIKVSISPATLTVTPKNGQSKVYGTSDPALEYTVSGVVNNEIPAFEGALSRDAGEDVDDYNIDRGSLTLKDNGTFKADNYTLNCTPDISFSITAKPVTATVLLTIPGEGYVYDGTAKTPAVEVKDDGTVIPASEYNVGYSDNTDAGTATVTITDKNGGNYIVSGSNIFTIAPKPLPEPTIEVAPAGAYDGTEKKPAVVVKDGENPISDYEYEVIYSNNINAGTATVTLTDKVNGNYTVSGSQTFIIDQQTGKTAATATTVQYFDTTEQAVDIAALIDTLKLAGDTPVYGTPAKGSNIAAARMEDGGLKFNLVSGLAGASELTDTIVVEVTGLTNYDKVTVTVTVTITPYKPVTVDMSGITLNSKVYDGQELTYSGEAVGSEDEPVAFIYKWYKKDVSGDYVLMTGIPKDSGDYQLKATVDTDGYSGSAVKEVTILKAAVTVRPEAFEITAGNQAPTLALIYTGLIGDETIIPDVEPIFAVMDAKGNAVALENAARSAGTYTITWSNAATTSFSDSDNYTVTKIETATLKVNSRPIIIPTYYTLNFVENGGTTIKNVTASYGVTIDLSKYTTTRTGYIFDGWYSDAALQNKITSIRMTKNTTVYAGWIKVTEPLVNPFKDIFESDWYYDDVMYVYEHRLMEGTAVDMFSPALTTTRGMIVTILYRLEGKPSTAGLDNPFTDLTQAWYIDAVKWAAANEIVEGYGNGKYGPEDPITREQMATILWRYAQYKGIDVSVGEDTNILSYNDAFDISEYAIPAMQWVCGEGIISGRPGGILDPTGQAQRCEVAAILHRFCELIEK